MTEVVVVGAVLTVALLLLVRGSVRSAVRDLGKSAGLPLSAWGQARGEIRGFRVEIDAALSGALEIRITGNLSDRFEFATRATPRPRFGGRTSPADVVTIGDPQFCGVTGDATDALSCLHADARKRIAAEAERTVMLRGGRLVCRVDPFRLDASDPAGLLDAMIGLAGSLSLRNPGAEALLHNALHDPIADVRDRNAMQLVAYFPESEAARSFVEHAGARVASGESWDGIASLLAPAVRVDYLARANPREIAVKVRTTKPPLLDRLLEGLSVAGKPGEAVLVAIVGIDPDDVTANRALALLAETAALSAIEPLRAARTFVSGIAFDNAIREIKSRAPVDADPGQLSLAGAASEAGAVSVVPQAGALSTPTGSRRD